MSEVIRKSHTVHGVATGTALVTLAACCAKDYELLKTVTSKKGCFVTLSGKGDVPKVTLVSNENLLVDVANALESLLTYTGLSTGSNPLLVDLPDNDSEYVVRFNRHIEPEEYKALLIDYSQVHSRHPKESYRSIFPHVVKFGMVQFDFGRISSRNLVQQFDTIVYNTSREGDSQALKCVLELFVQGICDHLAEIQGNKRGGFHPALISNIGEHIDKFLNLYDSLFKTSPANDPAILEHLLDKAYKTGIINVPASALVYLSRFDKDLTIAMRQKVVPYILLYMDLDKAFSNEADDTMFNLFWSKARTIIADLNAGIEGSSEYKSVEPYPSGLNSESSKSRIIEAGDLEVDNLEAGDLVDSPFEELELITAEDLEEAEFYDLTSTICDFPLDPEDLSDSTLLNGAEALLNIDITQFSRARVLNLILSENSKFCLDNIDYTVLSHLYFIIEDHLGPRVEPADQDTDPNEDLSRSEIEEIFESFYGYRKWTRPSGVYTSRNQVKRIARQKGYSIPSLMPFRPMILELEKLLSEEEAKARSKQNSQIHSYFERQRQQSIKKNKQSLEKLKAQHKRRADEVRKKLTRLGAEYKKAQKAMKQKLSKTIDRINAAENKKLQALDTAKNYLVSELQMPRSVVNGLDDNCVFSIYERVQNNDA